MLKFILVMSGLIILVAGGLWLNWQMRTPTHTRDWQPLYEKLPGVSKDGDLYHLTGVRNWTYGQDKSTSADWLDVTLDPSQITNVYFIVEPFGTMKAVAHTMLAFEFADGSGYVASVEARRAKGQAYGGLKAGVLPMHEYMFVWATERDMYANSTYFTDDALYLYRLELSNVAKRTVMTAMLDETAALTDTPQFYNTFFSNCTNILARTVNKVSPGALRWNKSWHLPGYAAEYLYDQGLIDAPDGFEALRAKSHITPLIDGLYDIEDPTEFAKALRARLSQG